MEVRPLAYSASDDVGNYMMFIAGVGMQISFMIPGAPPCLQFIYSYDSGEVKVRARNYVQQTWYAWTKIN